MISTWNQFIAAIFVFFSCAAIVQSKSGNSGCPKNFHSIGRKCYFFSRNQLRWADSHTECQKLNSTLLLVKTPKEDLDFRRYLNRQAELKNTTYWLDGIFNEQRGEWQEGRTGNKIQFKGFSRLNYSNKTQWAWHCIVVDPRRQNKWGANNCLRNNRYVCHTPNKYLTGKKYFDWSRCGKRRLSNELERQLCQKIKIANTAPGFLVMKSSNQLPPLNHVLRQNEEIFCKRNMILVGRVCYYFSQTTETFFDAFFACLNNKTRLAMPNTQLKSNILQSFLNSNFVDKKERWIGGQFDKSQQLWIWAKNAKPIKFQNFAKDVKQPINTTIDHIILDPALNNRWNLRSQFEKKHFICQMRPFTAQIENKHQVDVSKLTRNLNIQPQATILIKTVNDQVPTTERTLKAISIEATVLNNHR